MNPGVLDQGVPKIFISSLFRDTLTKKQPFIRQGARQMHEDIIVLTEMTVICRNDIVIFIICGKSAPFWQKKCRFIPNSIGWCIMDKHKKAAQALGRSLRSLFEQLAWRTLPAALPTVYFHFDHPVNIQTI